MKELIEKYLKTKSLDVRFYDSIDSTNTALRALAEEGAKEGTVLLAAQQTAGRGRRGRSFYSPEGTGMYMSILLRPKAPAQKILRITPAAAVAAAQTFEEISGESANIKWVNDVYMRGRKVCGILTEASITGDGVRYVIMGIGVYPPDGAVFPVRGGGAEGRHTPAGPVPGGRRGVTLHLPGECAKLCPSTAETPGIR